MTTKITGDPSKLNKETIEIKKEKSMNKFLITSAIGAIAAIAGSAQAQVVLTGTGYFTQAGGANPELQVNYSVTDNSGLYTYSYTFQVGQISNGNFVAESQNGVTSFAVDASYVVSANQSTLGATGIIGDGYVFWNYSNDTTYSDTVSFTSDNPPVLGGGSANDGFPSVSWSALAPGGVDVAVPVPEASTVLAGLLMVVPLGIGALRAIRKDREV
jgi:hypothetical protein